MDEDNEHSEAPSEEKSSMECQQLSNEERQLEVNRSSCTSAREVEDEINITNDECEINSSLNRCTLNENACGFEAAALPELAKQEVTKSNITGDEQKTECPQQLENHDHVVINRKSAALQSLTIYKSDTESDDSDVVILCSEDVTEPRHDNNKTKSEQAWRNNKKDDSDTSDSDSDSTIITLSSDSDSDGDGYDCDKNLNNSCREKATDEIASRNKIKIVPPVGYTGAVKKAKKKNRLKKKKKKKIEEYFPPIPDLSNININEEEEFIHLGELHAIVANLVTIESIPDIPAFDLDSILFIGDIEKKPLGPIFDVLGPVVQPIYCVRFNTEDEIKARGIIPGMKVYAAPKSAEFSKFVFVPQLLKMRGSDASGWCDQETPASFSDDELEQQVKREIKLGRKRKSLDNSSERHREYEKSMNQSNTINTTVCNLMDARKKPVRARSFLRPNATATSQSHIVAGFNPSVLPPGFGFTGQPRLLVPFITTTITNLRFPAYVPVFNGSPQFGSLDSNIASSYYLGAPFIRQNSSARQSNQGPENLQCQDNYLTNNSRNSNDPDPGPSSQP